MDVDTAAGAEPGDLGDGSRFVHLLERHHLLCLHPADRLQDDDCRRRVIDDQVQAGIVAAIRAAERFDVNIRGAQGIADPREHAGRIGHGDSDLLDDGE